MHQSGHDRQSRFGHSRFDDRSTPILPRLCPVIRVDSKRLTCSVRQPWILPTPPLTAKAPWPAAMRSTEWTSWPVSRILWSARMLAGDHPSGYIVTDALKRSTRRLGRAALERLRSRTGEPMRPLTLLRVGFT